jgi:hypothetical protein
VVMWRAFGWDDAKTCRVDLKFAWRWRGHVTGLREWFQYELFEVRVSCGVYNYSGVREDIVVFPPAVHVWYTFRLPGTYI